MQARFFTARSDKSFILFILFKLDFNWGKI